MSNWKNDYFNVTSGSKKTAMGGKRHTTYEPYKLVNLTGQSISFSILQNSNPTTSLPSASLISSFNETLASNNLKGFDQSAWTQVDDKCDKQFNFFPTAVNSISKSKASNSTVPNSNYHYAQRSHNNQLRKLVQNRIRIQLDDWSEIRPLTIDKVGTYYRDIYKLNADNSTTPNTIMRLIFDISLSENATKIIEIKSPVSVKNRLSYKLQCRIEASNEVLNAQLGPLIVEIDTDKEISIPIKYLPCNLWFRPLELDSNKEAEFNNNPLSLASINQPGQVEYIQMDCKLASSFSNKAENFQFFAKIRRHNFQMKKGQSAKSRQTFLSLPGHFISIEPAFTLYNLLPLEFRYKFMSSMSERQRLPRASPLKGNKFNYSSLKNLSELNFFVSRSFFRD